MAAPPVETKFGKFAFSRCASRDFKMSAAEDKVGTRQIPEERKRQWLAECAETHRTTKTSGSGSGSGDAGLGARAPACVWGNAFLRNVKYVPFDEFYGALLKSWTQFLTSRFRNQSANSDSSIFPGASDSIASRASAGLN